jgi:hypothetical protein
MMCYIGIIMTSISAAVNTEHSCELYAASRQADVLRLPFSDRNLERG